MLLTGVLAKDVGLIYGNTRTFLMHLLALVIVSVFSVRAARTCSTSWSTASSRCASPTSRRSWGST